MFSNKVIGCAISVVCAIVIFFPFGADGIWCFQCNSRTDEDCATLAPNDTTSSYYRECVYQPPKSVNVSGLSPPPAEMFCRKIYQKIHDREGLVRVIRRCGWILHPKKECYYYSDVGHQEVVCQCFSDGCNSAAKGEISTAALATSSILIAILYH